MVRGHCNTKYSLCQTLFNFEESIALASLSCILNTAQNTFLTHKLSELDCTASISTARSIHFNSLNDHSYLLFPSQPP